MNIYSYIFIALFVLTSFACQSQNAQISENAAKNDVPSVSNSLTNSENKPSDENKNELVETFSDDKNVGVKGKNKIEIFQYDKSKDNSVVLKFYSLNKDKNWELKQSIELIKYGGLSCDVKIKDFNNDGFNDVTYVSGIAARGANEIRRLFIYDKAKDELIYIKNSEDYPSLLYNKTLNCIDSQIITGSSETIFLKLDVDLLKEFASVDIFDTAEERRVYLIDKSGEKKLLRIDKITEDEVYERYKTFNPPTVYTVKELEQLFKN